MSTRTALRLNAAFSLLTGSLLSIAPSTVGDWLGVSIDGWLRLLGLGLLSHGVALFWVAAQRNVYTWTKINLAMVAPYPLLMVGLVATGLIDRQLGQALAIIDGAVVGLCALGQWAGLRSAPAVAQPQGA